MRRVSCKRCGGDGWVAVGPELPDTWVPGDKWPEGVHGWNRANCAACHGSGLLLTDACSEALATPQTRATPAAKAKPTQPGGLFGAR